MASLYELTGQFASLQEMMEDGDTDMDAVMDTMEALDFEIEAKADGYAKIIRNLTSDILGIQTELTRLASKKSALEHNIDRLRTALKNAMEATGKTKFKTELFSFCVANAPAAVVLDAKTLEDIPAEYLIEQEPKIDRQKLKTDIQSGKDLEGIAHLEQGKSLRIK